MKKILPILIILISFTLAKPAMAAPTTTITHDQAVALCSAAGITDLNLCYVPDNDVQFAAKNAVRSKDLLNWVLANYKWDNGDGQGNILKFGDIWKPVSFVVYATLGLLILAAAFLMIITRGKSLTVRKFIPRFILVVILVVLSFSLVKFLLQIGDVVQQFMLDTPNAECKIKNAPNPNISDCDLLSIGFNYDADPIGLRKPESINDEAVFTTVLMTKLTAATYYGMFGILIIRKIILWFFLIISAIFPLLLLFPVVRNSAKIWIGEFFRWLLYAPLFAIFLKGLVMLWQTGIGFTNAAGTAKYPTATDILLGGPGQTVGTGNNLSSPETFIQYVVALLMLWLVIALPFMLLKIFLDYVYNFSLTESNIVKYLATAGSQSMMLNRTANIRGPVGPGIPGIPGGPGVPSPASTGLARNIPVFEHSPIADIEKHMAETARIQQSTISQVSQPATAGLARKIEEQVAAQQAASAEATAAEQSAQAASATTINTASQMVSQMQTQTATPGVTVVVTREEARSAPLSEIYPRVSETFNNIKTTLSEPIAQMTEQFKEALGDVFNITKISIPTLTDVAKYDSEVETKETSERVESSKLTEIINRIAGVSPIATPFEKQQYAGVREKLVTESQKGNSVAHSILSAAVPAQAEIKDVNLVQQVNLEDYEQVKKLWKENYSKANPPTGPDGKSQDRKSWLKEEMKKIPQVIDLLLSGDPEKVKQGKEMVSKILPFLLLGGFSKAEIIAYLKAKLAAAKEVMDEILQVEKDEETKIEVDRKVEEKPKTMETAAEIPEEGQINPNNTPKPSTGNEKTK